jgi:hypothetical protein
MICDISGLLDCRILAATADSDQPLRAELGDALEELVQRVVGVADEQHWPVVFGGYGRRPAVSIFIFSPIKLQLGDQISLTLCRRIVTPSTDSTLFNPEIRVRHLNHRGL